MRRRLPMPASAAVTAIWLATIAPGWAEQERTQFRGRHRHRLPLCHRRRPPAAPGHGPCVRRTSRSPTTGNGRRCAFFTNEVQPFSVVLMIDCSGTMSDHLGLPRKAATEFIRTMLPRIARSLAASATDPFRARRVHGESRRAHRVARRAISNAGRLTGLDRVDQQHHRRSPLQGRRVSWLLTDGHDAPDWQSATREFRRVMDRARTADVMIYTIGFSASSERFSGAQRGPFGFPPGGGSARSTPLLSKQVQPPDPALKIWPRSAGAPISSSVSGQDLAAPFPARFRRAATSGTGWGSRPPSSTASNMRSG